MYVAKQARNEETRRRNMRVRNCQRSRFGFVARQLCGQHRNIYGQIEIWPPLAILARSPRDKFINLATLGGPSALLASRGNINFCFLRLFQSFSDEYIFCVSWYTMISTAFLAETIRKENLTYRIFDGSRYDIFLPPNTIGTINNCYCDLSRNPPAKERPIDNNWPFLGFNISPLLWLPPRNLHWKIVEIGKSQLEMAPETPISG